MREAGLYPPDPEHLYWKYWLGQDGWPGSRSYVLTDGTRLLAHLAVIPVSCRLESGTVRIASVVDWAARPGEAGAGARLMKHIGGLTDALLAIHPNPPASRVMQLIGYRPHGLATGYVRTLYPLRLLRSPVGPKWRLLPRLVRGTAWRLAAPRPDCGGWQARHIPSDQIDRIAPLLPSSRAGLVVLEREAAQLRYLLGCPTVAMRLYVLEEAHARGYFVLAFAPGQARLVDCWVKPAEPTAWRALIQCAVRQAQRNDDVAELTAWANDPLLTQCLVESGFHARRSVPIYLRTDNEALIAAGAIRVQMADSDAAYLHTGRRDLWA